MSGKATLQEIETHWSLDDVMRMNAMLDAQDHAEREAEKKAGKK